MNTAALPTALLSAIRRVEPVEAVYCDERAECPCGNHLHTETWGVEVFVALDADLIGGKTYCSRVCLALGLLWDNHPEQDQSEPALLATLAAIEAEWSGRYTDEEDTTDERDRPTLRCPAVAA